MTMARQVRMPQLCAHFNAKIKNAKQDMYTSTLY